MEKNQAEDKCQGCILDSGLGGQIELPKVLGGGGGGGNAKRERIGVQRLRDYR